MTNSKDLLKAAKFAWNTEKNSRRARSLATQIISEHANSPEAAKARLLLDELTQKGPSIDVAVFDIQMPGIGFGDIGEEINGYFFDNSIPEGKKPEAVIIMGGTAAGKSTLRKEQYSIEHVLIDAAQMYHNISGLHQYGFPEPLREILEFIGVQVTRRALSERRNIVTEIIGANVEDVKKLQSFLQAIGYKPKIVLVTADPIESLKWNINRGDNISAFYAEPFNIRWILEACADLVKVRHCFENAVQPLPTSKLSAQREDRPNSLPFKDAESAFEYACKICGDDLHEGANLLAIVLDCREILGTEHAVKLEDNGNQTALLKVASEGGGFDTVAVTAGPSGPRLEAGNLVGWTAMKFMPELAEKYSDRRSGWVGIISGTVMPALGAKGWLVDQHFE